MFWDTIHSLPGHFEPEIQRLVVCGQEGLMTFCMKTLMENGSGLSIDMVSVFRFDEAGKVIELRAYWDQSSMQSLPGS